MPLPDPETRYAPPGHYRFQISKEPEQRKYDSEKGGFISVTFYFKLVDDKGNTFTLRDSMVPWEPRYTDLARVLEAPIVDGRPRMSKIPDGNFVGKMFEAEVVLEPDKNDPNKKWPRLANIVIPQSDNPPEDDEVPPPTEEDDEVPF